MSDRWIVRHYKRRHWNRRLRRLAQEQGVTGLAEALAEAQDEAERLQEALNTIYLLTGSPGSPLPLPLDLGTVHQVRNRMRENRELRKALREYGKHRQACASHHQMFPSDGNDHRLNPCNCGLAEIAERDDG